MNIKQLRRLWVLNILPNKIKPLIIISESPWEEVGEKGNGTKDKIETSLEMGRMSIFQYICITNLQNWVIASKGHLF